MSTRFWLMKSEPEVFSIADLATQGRSLWDGVRNYQARNFMTKDMQVGDEILFYHSSCEVPGVAGRARVAAPAQPDPSQFDKKSPYYEPRATKDSPVWFCVEVEFVSQLPKVIPLTLIKETSSLKDLLLIRPGQRLSIQPLTEDQFKKILGLEKTL